MEFINGNKLAALQDRKTIFYMKIDEVEYINIPQHPFKLITHNGDLPVDSSSKKMRILEHPNLIKWYGQNITIKHDKLQAIPIGLDRSMNEDIYNIPDQKRERTIFVSYWGDSMVKEYRDKVRQSLRKRGYTQYEKMGIVEYLIELKKSYFCPCPNGNGIDTHRLWECIYMGCVPIVERSINSEYFKDLPILLIDSWDNMPELSIRLYNDIRKKSTEMADFNYWRKIIQA